MPSRRDQGIKSILLVDDDEDSLELYSDLLHRRTSARVVHTKHPSVAFKQAHNHFFDLVLIDVTMNYKGTAFGGLELYKSLMGKYGNSSLIAYSQLITDELLKEYDYDFNFCERGTSPMRFIDKLLQSINVLRKQQTCFIAMPFHKRYDALFKVIQDCVERAFYRCVRIDREYFTKSIVDKIFAEIYNAKLLIFLAADQNPNAFYECGFAAALDKEIITLTDVYKSLPFDIRDRNAIAYGRDLKKLDGDLMDKLSNLTTVR